MKLIGLLFGFRGRIGRGAFWLMILPWILILIALWFVLYVTLSVPKPTEGVAAWVYSTLSDVTDSFAKGDPPWGPTLFVIVAFLLFLSACVRRLHDLGKSQLLILVVFWPALFSLGVQALNLFGIDISRYLAPAQYPFLFYSYMIAAFALGLWQLVLFFQMAFVRGRRSLTVPQEMVAQQTPSQSA